MLRLVIPISHTDAELALSLLKHLSETSDSARNAPITLVLSNSVAPDEEKFRAAASEVSEDVTVKILNTEDERGWPWSANHVFQAAVRFLADAQNKNPWIWLEADCTPLTRDWLAQIETEYNRAGKPYLGTVRPTNLRDSEGVIQGTDGNHLIGVAVYPPNFHKRSILWNYLAEGPFDVYCRWEIVPVAHNSDLFAHTWRASNFRGEREKGFLWDGEDQTPIPAMSVLHHGCKDGSLLKILRGEVPPPPAPTKPTGKSRTVPVIKLEVDEDGGE